MEIAGPDHARRLGISIIYQELTLVPHLSVAENIFLGKAPRRWGFVDWRRMRDEAGTAAGRAWASGSTFGGRPAVSDSRSSRWWSSRGPWRIEARVLVMDEPTSALTGVEVEQLFATTARLIARGVAVVYISHRMNEVFRIGEPGHGAARRPERRDAGAGGT